MGWDTEGYEDGGYSPGGFAEDLYEEVGEEGSSFTEPVVDMF